MLLTTSGAVEHCFDEQVSVLLALVLYQHVHEHVGDMQSRLLQMQRMEMQMCSWL